MTDTIRPLIAGNWKMNGLKHSMAELEAMIAGAGSVIAKTDLLVCPPATLLATFAEKTGGILPTDRKALALGAQDCHPKASGAHTGDISAEMLADAGASFVIVGHSERRAMHGETDAVVAEKAKAVLARGLTPIVCVGETQGQREQGTAHSTVKRQLSAVIHALGHCVGEMVVAYEPVWAIGTGAAGSRRRHNPAAPLSTIRVCGLPRAP
jgi:triosephosphate isomerase